MAPGTMALTRLPRGPESAQMPVCGSTLGYRPWPWCSPLAQTGWRAVMPMALKAAWMAALVLAVVLAVVLAMVLAMVPAVVLALMVWRS